MVAAVLAVGCSGLADSETGRAPTAPQAPDAQIPEAQTPEAQTPPSEVPETERPASEGVQALLDPTSPEVADRLTGLGGRLAVGSANRLAIVQPDGSGLRWLEDDPEVVAAQPTWSRRGDRLAWSRTTAAGTELVFHTVSTGEILTSDLTGTSAFYLQWSSDDSTVAYLRNAPNGAGVELGVAEPGVQGSPLAATAPFFVSWAPTDATLVAHAGATRLVVLATGPANGSGDGSQPPDLPASIVDPTGSFSAPAWLDDRTVIAATPRGLARIDVDNGHAELLVELSDPVRFTLSPDRTKVAYQVPAMEAGLRIAFDPVPALPGLIVLDLVTGAQTTVTEEFAFWWEWSPDGKRLAWLTGFSRQRTEVRWSFWDGEISVASLPYRMSDQIVGAYLPFFEQYVQSVTGWSPDGTAFAFAGEIVGSGAQPGNSVWVQLLDSDDNGDDNGEVAPIRVAEGDVVTWSL